jgi:type IV pilus assembly protein PilN
MILFNLLPYRDILRQRKRQEFFGAVLLATLLAALLAVPTNLILEYFLEQANLKNQVLKAELAVFDKKIVEVADFELEISSLESRRKAVENLQSERNLPVQILSDLAQAVPEGAYLTAMSQESERIRLVGVAQSNQRVSDLLKNLDSKGGSIGQPELIEITSMGSESNTNDQLGTVQFTMYVKQKSRIGFSSYGATRPSRN